MMAFFLGLSVITLIECCCYCGFWCRRQCMEETGTVVRGGGGGGGERRESEGGGVERTVDRSPRWDEGERSNARIWTQQYKQQLQQRAAELEERAARDRQLGGRYREN